MVENDECGMTKETRMTSSQTRAAHFVIRHFPRPADHRLRPRRELEVLRLRSRPPSPVGNSAQDDGCGRKDSLRSYDPPFPPHRAEDHLLNRLRRADRQELSRPLLTQSAEGLQTVQRQANPRYYSLIEAFGGLTGVPLVLNTSFNENEPIVCRPEEALGCFLRTQMDVLVLGDWFIERRNASSATQVLK